MNTKIVIIKTNGKSCDNCPFDEVFNSCNVCKCLNVDDDCFINECTDINLDNPLNSTILQMTSDDYKDRFIAEFNQTYIRFTKLRTMIQKWDKNELNFTPTCPRDLYEAQLTYMYNYLSILWIRAQLEHIELNVNPEDVEAFNSIENNYL